jgi:hypothetical protein
MFTFEITAIFKNGEKFVPECLKAYFKAKEIKVSYSIVEVDPPDVFMNDF